MPEDVEISSGQLVDTAGKDVAVNAGLTAWTQTFSTADRTVANATATALTDSTTGTAGATLAAGVGCLTLCIPVTAMSAIGNADVLTTYTPGYKFKILSVSWAQGTPVTTGSKVATLTPKISGTAVTGGVVALASATCTPLGVLTAGSAVTAANTGSASDTISVTASAVTAFVEGSGYLLVKVQNMDTADAVASISVKLTALIADDLDNRSSITALIDDLQTIALAE